MSTPATLPADFFNQQQAAPASGGATSAPDTLPADFFAQQQQQIPQMSASPPHQNDPQSLLPDTAGPFERGAMQIASPFARKLMDAVDKLREVEDFGSEERAQHPIQAHMGDVANRIEGFLFGNERHPEAGIGSGKYGMLNNPVTGMLIPGKGGSPAAAEAIEGGANLLKSGAQAVKGAISGGEAAGEAAEATAKGPSYLQRVMKGKEVAQEPGKAGIRTALGAGEETSILEGHKTAADDLLSKIKERENTAYTAQDKEAQFDVKETRQNLKQAEWKVKQPEIDDATHERLTKSIAEMKQSLSEAEARMKAANIDPKAADTLFKQRKAGEEFRKALVTNTSHDGETVNIDGLLNSIKKLRNTPRGDRMEQFIGKEAAEKLITDLETARKQGEKAVETQKFTKMVAKYVGLGALSSGGVGAVIHALTH